MTPEEVFLKLVHGVADRDFAYCPAVRRQTDVRHRCTVRRPPLLSGRAARALRRQRTRVTEVVPSSADIRSTRRRPE